MNSNCVDIVRKRIKNELLKFEKASFYYRGMFYVLVGADQRAGWGKKAFAFGNFEKTFWEYEWLDDIVCFEIFMMGVVLLLRRISFNLLRGNLWWDIFLILHSHHQSDPLSVPPWDIHNTQILRNYRALFVEFCRSADSFSPLFITIFMS